MKLTWLGHSCFRVEYDDYAIVLDPYAPGSVPGLAPLDVEADEVLCSHEHGDHGYRAAVRLRPARRPSPFSVTRVASAHDERGGSLRGPNTVHVLEAGGVRAAHLGDLGCLLNEAQARAIGPLDALMLPVGGHYTIDARQARAVADLLAPRTVLPMHYRTEAFGFDVLAPLEECLPHFDNVLRLDENSLSLVPGMPRQTIVLAYRP